MNTTTSILQDFLNDSRGLQNTTVEAQRETNLSAAMAAIINRLIYYCTNAIS